MRGEEVGERGGGGSWTGGGGVGGEEMREGRPLPQKRSLKRD